MKLLTVIQINFATCATIKTLISRDEFHANATNAGKAAAFDFALDIQPPSFTGCRASTGRLSCS